MKVHQETQIVQVLVVKEEMDPFLMVVNKVVLVEVNLKNQKLVVEKVDVEEIKKMELELEWVVTEEKKLEKVALVVEMDLQSVNHLMK